MSVELITILMFACMFGFLVLGLPVALSFAGTAMIFAVLMAPRALIAAPYAYFTAPWQPVVLTMPMFIFMGSLIRYSGVAEAAYDMTYKLVGALGGGLAIGTVFICTLFAAISGVAAPATITMGLIALPSMLKYKYDKTIAVGCIGAGGALGTLIPPSIPFILYAVMAQESVGALFMGGVMPGLLLATMYAIYIGIRCKLQPHMGPPIPPEEKVSRGERIRSVTAIWPFLALICLVLGLIWMGVATPSEASCFGAFGALLLNIIYRRLTWPVLKDSLVTAVRLGVMGMWIFIGANLFINVFSVLGCQDLVTLTILAMPGGKWGILAVMMVSILILGCLMDEWAIITLCTPLYVPIITALGFSKLWFGIIFIVNIQVAYLSPPFGFVLFWLKSIVPPGVTMGDVYRSVIPFVIMQLIGLTLVIIFPQIGLWLPSMMIK